MPARPEEPFWRTAHEPADGPGKCPRDGEFGVRRPEALHSAGSQAIAGATTGGAVEQRRHRGGDRARRSSASAQVGAPERPPKRVTLMAAALAKATDWKARARYLRGRAGISATLKM